MAIFAIGDLHLSFGVPNKKMDVFGGPWINHEEKTAAHWKSLVKEDDLVLIPGDISWAKHKDDVMPDLLWIDSLPGTKLMIRGNHDYWWNSLSKVKAMLPPSIHAIQNDSFEWNDFIIGGARLWDSSEYSFSRYIPMVKNPRANPEKHEESPEEAERIFVREIDRLRLSLETMKNSNKTKIVMTHYPPIGADLKPSRVSSLLEEYKVNTCVFGHLHHVHTDQPLFGEKDGIRYILTSGDYINFVPVRLY